VRVISKRTLREFWQKHNDCKQQLKYWFRETEKANWKNMNELKKDFSSASILLNFEYQICYIRFIGTHADYDKIDANNV